MTNDIYTYFDENEYMIRALMAQVAEVMPETETWLEDCALGVTYSLFGHIDEYAPEEQETYCNFMSLIEVQYNLDSLVNDGLIKETEKGVYGVADEHNREDTA